MCLKIAVYIQVTASGNVTRPNILVDAPVVAWYYVELVTKFYDLEVVKNQDSL